MAKPILTQEIVRDLVCYNPVTGEFKWKKRSRKYFSIGCSDRVINSWNSRYSGKTVGTHHKEGYLITSIFKSNILLHRLAWIHFHGYLPTMDLDHINHKRTDNRIANLREVTRSENLKNRLKCIRNKSGIVGVYFNKGQSKWYAKINHEMNSIWLGSFSDKFEAVCARKRAENKYGFHENHGKDS